MPATETQKPAKKVSAPQGAKRNAEPFRGEKERRRKQLIERFILGATVAFCLAVVFAVWYSEGRVLEDPVRFLQTFEVIPTSRDIAQNCRHPKNRNTPYCQERLAKIESDWQSMNRTQDGKVNPFTLHHN